MRGAYIAGEVQRGNAAALQPTKVATDEVRPAALLSTLTGPQLHPLPNPEPTSGRHY